jgi:hypothetical protein
MAAGNSPTVCVVAAGECRRDANLRTKVEEQRDRSIASPPALGERFRIYWKMKCFLDF